MRSGTVCSFPVAMGDVVYEIYSGKMYPCVVTGFLVTEQGKYVTVQDSGDRLEHQILLSNICLSQEEAEKKIKEDRVYEKSTNGRTGTEVLG